MFAYKHANVPLWSICKYSLKYRHLIGCYASCHINIDKQCLLRFLSVLFKDVWPCLPSTYVWCIQSTGFLHVTVMLRASTCFYCDSVVKHNIIPSTDYTRTPTHMSCLSELQVWSHYTLSSVYSPLITGPQALFNATISLKALRLWKKQITENWHWFAQESMKG